MATPVAANVILGPAVVWYAPVAEAKPDETTIALGVDWGGNWERLGLTKTPLSVLYEFDEIEIEVEEALSIIRRGKTMERATLETTIAEITADYFQLAAASGTVASTAAGASQVAFEELTLGGIRYLDELQWGFEGTYQDDAGDTFPIRLFFHKATARLNGALTFGRAESPGIPLQVKGLADLSKAAGNQLMQLQRVTAEATS